MYSIVCSVSLHVRACFLLKQCVIDLTVDRRDIFALLVLNNFLRLSFSRIVYIRFITWAAWKVKAYSVKENISFDQNKVPKFRSRKRFFPLLCGICRFCEFVDFNFSTIGIFDLLASSRGHIFQEGHRLQENERFGGAFEFSQVTCISCLKIKIDFATESKLIKGCMCKGMEEFYQEQV